METSFSREAPARIGFFAIRPTRLSNSALTPPDKGEACTLARAIGLTKIGRAGWLVHCFAALPRAPLALARRGSRGARRRSTSRLGARLGGASPAAGAQRVRAVCSLPPFRHLTRWTTDCCVPDHPVSLCHSAPYFQRRKGSVVAAGQRVQACRDVGASSSRSYSTIHAVSSPPSALTRTRLAFAALVSCADRAPRSFRCASGVREWTCAKTNHVFWLLECRSPSRCRGGRLDPTPRAPARRPPADAFDVLHRLRQRCLRSLPAFPHTSRATRAPIRHSHE